MSPDDPLDRVLGPLDHLPTGDPALDALARRAAEVEAELDRAARGIDRAVERALAPTARGVELVETGPDAELVAAIRMAQVGTRGVVGDAARGAITAVQTRLWAMIDAVRHAARVETRDAAGRLVAVSAMGWGGDCSSVMGPELTPDDLDRHRRRFAASAGQRRGRVRFVMVVVTGLARVSAAVAAGGVAALPALYRYVEQVLDAFDDLPAAPATTPGAST